MAQNVGLSRAIFIHYHAGGNETSLRRSHLSFPFMVDYFLQGNDENRCTCLRNRKLHVLIFCLPSCLLHVSKMLNC
jgi:hypothetical protein